MTAADPVALPVSGRPVSRCLSAGSGWAIWSGWRRATIVFRALDYHYGGGSCRDAVHAQMFWDEPLLRVEAIDTVKTGFQGALADLHNLASWTSFDTGLVSQAYRQFQHALDLTHWRGNGALVANVRYRLGRIIGHDTPRGVGQDGDG